MISLRDYQDNMISETRAAMRQYRRVLLQAPTGAGKTVLASFMVQRVVSKSGIGFFICHRRELLDQTALTFDRAGIEHGFIAAGRPFNPHHKVYVASIDTLKNRIGKVPVPKLAIWDEAHHLGAAGWQKVHNAFRNSWHVGLSATPQRLDGRGLDDSFDTIVNGPSVAWLIENGYLANYKLFSVPGARTDAFHVRMGDFVKTEVEAEMDRPTITGDIIKHWRRHASDRLTIGFCVSVKQSENLAATMRANGIMAVHLDGTTPHGDRRSALQAFARGDIRVITNVGLFGEGFDVAANSGMDVTVGAVIDAAPTQSLGAYLQRCGRALRPQPGHAIILDHAGNAMRHGLPCDEREWSLEGVEKKGRSAGGEASNIKQCPECFFVHQPRPTCPNCQHVYEVQHRQVAEVEGDLEEVDAETLRRQRGREQGMAKTYDALVNLGRQRGYKNPEGWARHIYNWRRGKKMAG